MSNNFHVIIPARYESTRFPGKLLTDLKGMSVLERVYRQALKANPASILIATDHEAIANHAMGFGAEVVMTKTSHQSGTDRIAEAVKIKGFSKDTVIVNVQGDEPLIHPALIQQVAQSVSNLIPMATLCAPIKTSEQFHNPNVVKVVRASNGNALYFSRKPIPANRNDADCFQQSHRHIGLYAYRAGFLLDYVTWPVCELEICEGLEQLRVLWAGHPIVVEAACVEPMQDINTPEDLDVILDLM